MRQRGADPTGLGHEWGSLRGAKLSTAVDLARQIPGGTSTTPGAPSPGAVTAAAEFSGKAGSAVDVAKSFEGMGEHNAGYAPLKKFMGQEIRGAQNAWCAAFVNSSLKAVGMKGTGSGVATSFLGWGKGVDANDVQKGDVAVEHRGRSRGQTDGHVGMATGNTRTRNGQLEVEVISGNSSDQVKTEWERASKLAIRRSTETSAQAAAAAANPSAPAQAAIDGFTSTGWKVGAGGNAEAVRAATSPAQSQTDLMGRAKAAAGVARGLTLDAKAAAGAARAVAPSASTLAKEAAPSAEDLAKSVPAPEQRASLQGGGGGGGCHTFSAPITINAGNQSPQELAGHLQRHITEGWNFRAHDLEPELT